MNIIKTFIVVLIPLIIIDAVWLMVISKSFYTKHLGHLMAPNPVWVPIVLFYIIYALGIGYFIVSPALQNMIPWWQVLLRGAFFGFIAYAAYDLTNHAILANWSTMITVVDLAWGTVLTAIVSVIAYSILK